MAQLRRIRKLRLGVVGLGRLWETRHKPALARLADRVRVAAVYDQVGRRAEIEAAALGCTATSGLRELVERSDVDAVCLPSPQWFGLHALEVAAEAGKPIYCAVPPACEPGRLDRLDAVLGAGGVVFVPELARRWYPATLRLRELLATRLGRPRRIVGRDRLAGFDRYSQPGPSTQVAAMPLLLDPVGSLLDWCRFICNAEPVAIQDRGDPSDADGADRDVESFTAEFPDGAVVEWTVSRHPTAGAGAGAGAGESSTIPPPGVQVDAEQGSAWIEMPDRIVWRDAGGEHDERLPQSATIGESLLAQFVAAATTGAPSAPSWRDALAVARLTLRLKG